MKNFSSLIGWLILISVLAVPAFMFYNWMSSKKTEQAAQVRPVVDQSRLFNSGGKDSALVTPGSAGVSSADQPPARQPAAKVQISSPAVLSPVSVPEASPVVPERGDIAPKDAAAPQSPPVAAKPGDAVALSTMSYYDPKSKRDPTLTAQDYRKIKEEEDRISRALRQRALDAKKRKADQSPLVKMTLQGVVGTSAIINGEMVNEGQVFKGLKVIKVGANYVIGVYGGKRYRLVLK